MSEPIEVTEESRARSSKKREKLLRERELRTITEIMSTPQGRSFLQRVLDAAGLYDDGFHHDALVMAQRAGVRKVGLWLRSELMEASLELFTTLESEARIQAKGVTNE